MDTDSSLRPQKRSRTDSEISAEIRRSDIWLDDGNIILEAQRVQFRVHKSVLASNSTVFRDMFQVSSSAVQPTVESVPMVELHDKFTDVEHVLRALYDRTFFNPLAKPNLAVLSSCLRLGTKYEIKHLRKDAITALSLICPTTLSQWDSVYLLDAQQRRDGPALSTDAQLLGYLALAQEFDLGFLYPALYLRLCMTMTQVQLWEKIADLHSLKILTLGVTTMLNEFSSTLYIWIYPYALADCEGDDECFRTRQEILSGQMQHGRMLDDFLISTRELVGKLESRGICTGCCERCEIEYPPSRETFWDKLPAYFECGTWSVLRKQLATELGEEIAEEVTA